MGKLSIKIGKIIGWIFVSILVLLLLVIVAIQIPYVQNKVKDVAITFVQDKIGTPVRLDRIEIAFPKKIVVKGLYLESQQKDTLLYTNYLGVDISLFKLISSTVDVSKVELDDFKANITRDSLGKFNFDYIIDAFASEDDKEEEESGSMKIEVGEINLSKLQLSFQDEYDGHHLKFGLNKFITRFKQFDLDEMKFALPKIAIDGVDVDYKKLPASLASIEKANEVVMAEASEDTPAALPTLNLGTITLSNSKVLFDDTDNKMYAKLTLGEFLARFDGLDLVNQQIDINEIKLEDTTGVVRLLPNKEAKTAEKKEDITAAEPAAEEVKTEEVPWKLGIKDLALNKINVKYDDSNVKPVAFGLDPNHIEVTDLNVKLKDFQFSSTNIVGNLERFSFNEQSGLKLDNFKTYFLYGEQTAFIKDFVLETPNTHIKSSIILNYVDVNKLVDDIANMSIDATIEDSHLGLQDVYLAMPTVFDEAGLKGMNNKTFTFDAKVKGVVDDLTIDRLMITGLQATVLNVQGGIKGLPVPEKTMVDLKINKVQTSAKDIMGVAPKGVVPDNIQIPAHMTLNGFVKGGMQAIQTQLALKTTAGNVDLKASLDQRRKGKEKYSLLADVKELQVGSLIKNDSIGNLTMRIQADGTSFEPTSANATAVIDVAKAEFNGYTYNNLKVDGAVENGKYKVTSVNNDPNLTFDLQADGVWTEQGISLNMLGDFKHIDLHKLHIEDKPAVFSAVVDAKMNNVMPDDLDGQLRLKDVNFISAERAYSLMPIELTATAKEAYREMNLTSQLIDFNIKGEYKLTELGDKIGKTIAHYFDSEGEVEKPIKEGEKKEDNQHFTYTINVKDNPIIHKIVPELTDIKPIAFSGKYDADSNYISLTGNIPLLKYGDNEITNISVDVKPYYTALGYSVSVERIANASIGLRRLNLKGAVQDNKLAYDLNLKDSAGALCYVISGELAMDEKDMVMKLYPNGFMLDYAKWDVNPDNRFVIKPEGFYVKDFVLTQGKSALVIESEQEKVNSPLSIKFKEFSIETLTKMVKKDVLLASGFINGEVNLKDLTTDMRFVSDIDIRDLHAMEIALGNLHVGVKNESASKFIADVVLEGGDNRIELDGWADADTKEMSLDLDLAKLQMDAFEYFAKEHISNAEGYFNGKLNVGGKFDDPRVLGALNFNNIGLHVNDLNADFKNINEKISFTNRGIELDKFSITDVDGNLLVIDGQILTKAYQDFKFNLLITALDFKAVNSTVKDNDMYYGTLVFDTRISIQGDLNKPVVTGGIEIGKKTNFTFVMPQEDPSIADREGIVEFVDQESLQVAEMKKYEDDFNNSALKGLDVSLAIKVDKDAAFTMVMDKSSGDKILLKGNADLVGGIDPSGKVTLAGRYEFSEGAYDLSFNMLKRRFEVEKGSYIIWAGDPTDATLNLTAIYETSTAPMDLLGGQLSGLSPTQQNMYKQRIPFQALLKMEGELLKPEISFDLRLKEGITSVSGDVINNTKTKLEQLRTNESEMNKQVFALLLLNRFIGENPFESSAGGMTAGAMARQSVSRLLSDQLNNLASNLISGVELNFNLESSEDFSSGNRENRTDLNVAVSKRLFSDRLKVTVGSSFEVEGNQRQNEQANNIAGDIELEYALSKDGRYLMRVYRKNRYEVALQGQIVETGVGFIITMSYEKFKELFENSRDKRQLKKRLRDEVKDEK